MASSASKPRASSPFRFRKPSTSMNGKLPGYQPIPSSYQSSSSQSGSKASSYVERSLTPSRVRSLSQGPPMSAQKFRLSSGSSVSFGSPITPTSDRFDFLNRAKENISVTVRFRPLSAREIQRGDEVAWYADGDTTVRSEYHTATAYAYDRVFGPATTTRGVYDVAAQHVVGGAMEGVNGTVFAYGVTSSGKTHTMHGDQKSPGIIPLAVKDVFNIIQETPSREFLLRVSYLEIYNEVINDLLDPAGQNLRVREDAQGTYVEGIKEEVVLSPAHALSLIAAGEELRHVGSNNFNLLSSRSHTIFTLTVESSARDDDDEEVTLSQLNLIDLAGSESSKTETTGLRRKEGSYINKSLLTLGTVIAKLSDGKASHIPYRDSKLTRLLQSSLSGHGRISLICTITPASSNTEETHNTLKFAHRAKCVEIHAAPNRILDEKSLIKKYQKEITNLKQELDQLKRGIIERPFLVTNHEDLLTLRQQLEAGQVKLQSRLEEEEQAKAALMGRIQRLTKLILVSTKNTIPASIPERPVYRRRHSFGEEELAYLPDKRRDFTFLDDEDESIMVGPESDLSASGKGESTNGEEVTRDEKKSKRRSMLAWFKLRRNENLHASPVANGDTESSPNGSPAPNGSPMVHFDPALDYKGGRRKSHSRKGEELSTDPFSEPTTQAGELFSATVRGRRPPPTGTTMADQMDLLREQVKMLAGEVAFCTSSLKRLSEQAANNPDDFQLEAQMQKLKEEIEEKRRQMQMLEERIIGSGEATPASASSFELSQTIVKLTSQLNEKAFDLEIKTADNRILQEQLQAKTVENNELQDTILSLRQQFQAALDRKSNPYKKASSFSDGQKKANGFLDNVDDWLNTGGLSGELRIVEKGSESNAVVPQSRFSKEKSEEVEAEANLQAQVLKLAADIEKLKQEKARLADEKDGLHIQSQKLADEASYAKELASAAAVELKNLAEEVTKLSFHNAKLSSDLAAAQEMAFRVSSKPIAGNGHLKHTCSNDSQTSGEAVLMSRTDRSLANGRFHSEDHLGSDVNMWGLNSDGALLEMKRELQARMEKELSLESSLAEKQQSELELQKKLDVAKQREAGLENDLASMWVLVAKLKKEKENFELLSKLEVSLDTQERDATEEVDVRTADEISMKDTDGLKVHTLEKESCNMENLKNRLEEERQRSTELETIVSHLKSEELDGLEVAALEDLQNLHVEALTKLCHAKAKAQERIERERERDKELQSKLQYDPTSNFGLDNDLYDDERNGHVCKVCFEAPTAAVLLPCRHFC
ncbi:hypothetical protein O6H91_06G004200 [Diphasiastrum complanatum]|nr:hypothetical protein O6H91_06G004200 [Diphasiastrum complanatum]